MGNDHFRSARHSERVRGQQRENETELVAYGDLDGAAGRIVGGAANRRIIRLRGPSDHGRDVADVDARRNVVLDVSVDVRGGGRSGAAVIVVACRAVDDSPAGCLARRFRYEMIGVKRMAEAGDPKQHGHEKDEHQRKFDEGASAFSVEHTQAAGHTPHAEEKNARRRERIVRWDQGATRMVAVRVIVMGDGIPG